VTVCPEWPHGSATPDVLLNILAETLTQLDKAGVNPRLGVDAITTELADISYTSGAWVVSYYTEPVSSECARAARECHDIGCGRVDQAAIHVGRRR
jgi:hypothetical protein